MKIAADYLLSLINDVLQMSKIEEGHIVLTHEYICLKDLVYEIESIITHKAADEDIQWIYEKNKENIPYPYVYGSSLHLRQIFLNIYGNCIKYNRPGGKITTVMEAADVHDGICTYRWTISDTGIGMSPEFLSHIFDPFSQEKTDARSVYQGTGLGMAITKGLIEQMNGSIEVTSQVGVGSVFVITIPFEIAREQKKDKEIAEKYDIRGLHLLAAEDNELNAEIIEMLLTDDGAKVTVAKNGRQAVEHFENNPPGTFDAILMDVMMPELDGFSACREIRKFKKTPIIMLSARGEEYDKIHGFELGSDDYVVKPFSPKELMMRVNAVIKRSQGAQNEENVKKDVFTYEGLSVDFSARIVTIDGKRIEMTPKEYELFFYMVKNKGLALTREKLISEVWGYDFFGDERTLDTHIKLLRKEPWRIQQMHCNASRGGLPF